MCALCRNCCNSVSGIADSVKPQSKQDRSFEKTHFVQTLESGKMNGNFASKVAVVAETAGLARHSRHYAFCFPKNGPTFVRFHHDLTRLWPSVGLPLSLIYHSLNLLRFPPGAIHSPHNLAFVLLSHRCHAASTQLGEDYDPADRGRPQDIGTTYRAYRA